MVQTRHISHKIIFSIEFFGGWNKKLWSGSRKNKWTNNNMISIKLLGHIFKKMIQNRHISYKIIFSIEFFGDEEKKLWSKSRKNKWINNNTKSTHFS